MLTRQRLPELMDDPALDPSRHRQALRGLARINRWGRSAQILWPAIRLAAGVTRRPLRILDIATGAGDVPLALWRMGRRIGYHLEIAGCDRSATAVAYARERAEQAGADIQFFALDALAGPLPSGYDVLTSSLFLHHLDEPDAVSLLRHMASAGSPLVLISDLRRSHVGLALAHLGTRLLSASTVVHTDGPRSVRAAYTPEEVRALAEQSGLLGATITRRWPCRFLLNWRHS